jgi:hypothetical protein
MIKRQMMLVAEGRKQVNQTMSDWAANCLEWTRHHALELA